MEIFYDINKFNDKIITLLKLCEPVLWTLPITMFAFGYISTNQAEWHLLIIGIFAMAIADAAANLLNKYTDQEEDRINSLDRIILGELIGYKNIVKICIVTFTLYFFFIIWSSFLINLTFALVLLIQIMIGIFYSWGPRLKANFITSLISFSFFLVILPFTAGWVISKPLVSLSPILFIILAYFLAYGSIRNLPDIEGDRRAGIKTTLFPGIEMPLILSLVLLAPYLFIIILILAGILELKYLAIFMVLPLSAALIRAIHNARSVEEKKLIRTLEQFHRWIFLILLLLIYYPTINAFLAAIILSTLRFLFVYFNIDIRFTRIDPNLLKNLLIKSNIRML